MLIGIYKIIQKAVLNLSAIIIVLVCMIAKEYLDKDSKEQAGETL